MENISHSDFEHSITEEDYKPLKDINDSYFGKITFLKNQRANQNAIKKQINISDLTTYHRLLEDYSFYISLEHKHLVKVFGITANDHSRSTEASISGLAKTRFPEICLYFEQVKTNLESILQKRRAPHNTANSTQILSDKTAQGQKLAYFEEAELFDILLSLVDALEYLQQNSICHGDLRPGACFMSAESTWKIFNRQLLSENNIPYQRAKERKNDVYLTPIAFESVGKRLEEPIENKYKADIFALGMTLLECATLKRSTQIYDWNNFSINKKVLTQRLDEVKQRYSPYFYEMLSHTVELDEERRPDSIKLKELIEQRKLDLTAISNLVVEEEENFLKDLILKIDPKQTAFSQNDSSFQPFAVQKPLANNSQLKRLDPESISIDEMSSRTGASLADFEHAANIQTFRNEDLQSSSRNFLGQQREANALLSKKIVVVETFSGLPTKTLEGTEAGEEENSENGHYSECAEVKSSNNKISASDSFQGNITYQSSHNSFKEPPREFHVDTRNTIPTTVAHNLSYAYQKAISLKEMMKKSSFDSQIQQEEEQEFQYQDDLVDQPQIRLHSVPNEQIVEEEDEEDDINDKHEILSTLSSGTESMRVMEQIRMPLGRDKFHLDLENLLSGEKKSQPPVVGLVAPVEKKEEILSEVEDLLSLDKNNHHQNYTEASSPAIRLETIGEGAKSTTDQEAQTAPRRIHTESEAHLNETCIKKPSALLVKTLVQEALEKAKRCREAVKKSKEQYETFQNSRNFYLPNFRQNFKKSAINNDNSYYTAKKCVTEADRFDSQIDYDALLNIRSRQNLRTEAQTRYRNSSHSPYHAQGKNENVFTTPSQSYLPSSISKFDISFHNSPMKSLATEPNFDVSRDASINLSSSILHSNLRHHSSILKDRSKSPTPNVNLSSAYTPVKQPFTFEDQLAKSKPTLTPENSKMVNQFKDFIQSKVRSEGLKRGISTENLKKSEYPSISTNLVQRDENKLPEYTSSVQKSFILNNNDNKKSEKFDVEEQFQRAMEKAKMASDYATKVRSTIDRTEKPRATSNERYGVRNYY